jgi:hypothetical protein
MTGAGFIYFYALETAPSVLVHDQIANGLTSDSVKLKPVVIQETLYDRSNWKTYHDPLGYEFQYPPEWKLVLAPREWAPELLESEVYLYPKEIPYGPPPLLQIDVRAATSSNSPIVCSHECSEIVFNGDKTFMVLSGYATFYSFVHNSAVYTLWYEPTLTEYGITESQAKAVLTSFKITDR